jgi:hypothetical protein
MSYIENQLARLNSDPDYKPTIRITDSDGNKTNGITLSPENAKGIALWLLENFVDKNDVSIFKNGIIVLEK